jgi:hypothetical protein
MDQEPGQDRLSHPLPVYLVHWRQPSWCASAVRSIRTSDVPVEATVLNNSPELAASLEDHLSGSATVVPMPGNLGYTGAANQALALWQQGSEPYAVIASHDLHVARDTFRLLLGAANELPTFGIFGPILTDKLAGANVPSEPHINTTVSVPWVSGACMLLRRECMEEIGGFDESLGSYIEDVELCLRARRAGWEVGLVPSALAHGLGTGDRRAADRGAANAMAVTLRYEGRLAALRAWLGALRLAGARTLWALRHLFGPSRRTDFERAADQWFVTAAGLPRVFSRRSST